MQYVYLIKNEPHCPWDYFKIGVAADVESRLAQLQTGNPYLLSIESCWQFDNAQAVETVLHQKYKNERVRGEWFNLIPSQAEEFDSLCDALGGIRYVPDEEVSDMADVEEAEEMAESVVPTSIYEDSENYRIERRYSPNGELRGYAWRERHGGRSVVAYIGKRNKDFDVIDAKMRIGDFPTEQALAEAKEEAK